MKRPLLSVLCVLFVLSAALQAAEPAPSVSRVLPAPNSTVPVLASVEAIFDGLVTGVDASDLLVNGKGASNVWAAGPGQYVFEFPQPQPGLVTFAWAAGHGIANAADPSSLFAGGSWSVMLNTNAPLGGVILNEILAINKTGLHDEDGDKSDWIELRNLNSVPLSLEGWFLTDDPANLSKWRFPDVTLDARGYLLVFASGKDRTANLNRLHANFQLASDGEFLALVNPLTNIVSAFAPAYPPQQADISYGRDPLSPELTGPFLNPTPGAANIEASAGLAPEVRFSVEGGTFISPFQLYLSSTEPAAEIHYTVNFGGSTGTTNVPTLASPIYTGPIAITASAQVRARAFRRGFLPGPPRTETYIQIQPEAANFSSDLPIVILHNLGQGAVPTSGDQPAYIAIFEPDKRTGRATLTSRPVVNGRIGLNIRGRGSQGYPKSAFAVEFWDEYNQDKNVEVLGMPAESDWVFYGTLDTDGVDIHNTLAREMSNILGRKASRTRFAEVFLNTAGGPVNFVTPKVGNYNGLYVIIEKIKQGKGRVDIASLQNEDMSPDVVSGGYIFKSDDPVESDEYAFTGARQQIITVYPGKKTLLQPQRLAQLNYVKSFFNGMSNGLFGASWTNPVTGYAQYIDVDSWIDHLLISVTTFNVDAIRLSGYFYKDRNKPMEMGPIWDYDRSLGSTDTRQLNPRRWRGTDGDGGTDYFNPPGPGPVHQWFGRLCRDIDFWQKYVDRYESIREGPYSLTNLYRIIDEQIAQLTEAQPRDQNRWAVALRGPNGTGSGTFATEVIWLKTWLSNRLDFMDTNFLALPSFGARPGLAAQGSLLTLTAPVKAGSEVYYTLDGTDPRGVAGIISSNALLYKDPIVLTTNIAVFARAYNPNHKNLTGLNNPPLSTPWSGPRQGTFIVKMPPLVITEIMYHPTAAATTLPGTTASDYEYVEVKNIGSDPLVLEGFRLTNGITFNFRGVGVLSPGVYGLIVKNRSAFKARYPSVTNILGEYEGNLSNGGNRLTLLGPLGEPILDFRYEDNWQPASDGLGFSLAVTNETAPPSAWSASANWRASSRWLGTPGQPESPSAAIPAILVNEALANSVLPASDFIELFNPNTIPVDISGWFLSDDLGDPMKFRIPAGTIIKAEGFIVFDESNFNKTGDPKGFALSRTGDEVYLLSGNGTNLTGYFHGFKFGASDAGVSFGRVRLSSGEDIFLAQAAPTPGGANSPPKSGPIVIDQIGFDPIAPLIGTNLFENTALEFIRLRNIADVAVALSDPANPAHTWRITGGIGFDFPPGVSVPPGGMLAVVPFDPALDPYLVERFRLQSGLAPNVPLYGPFSGRLGNEDDHLSLEKPGAPESASAPNSGAVPYVLVDQVDYSTRPPWPAYVPSQGFLQRLNPASFGSEGTNWSRVSVVRPIVDSPPASQAVAPGANAAFSLAAHGSGALSYQWRFNGVDIPGANQASLQLNNLTFTNSGWYDARITSADGSVLSARAFLTILMAPAVVRQPQGGFFVAGSDLALSVLVTNTANLPISYRWRRGSTVVNSMTLDARESILSLPRVQASQAGVYTVIVSNAAVAGSVTVTSTIAPVMVVAPPANVIATLGTTTTIRATVSAGTGNTVANQWFFNSKLIPDEANDILTIADAQPASEGIYTLAVADALGNKASYSAGLGLRVPVVLSEPRRPFGFPFQMNLRGIPYQIYRIDSSTNLLGPWEPLVNLFYTNGVQPLLDARTTTNTIPHFYRAVTPP